MLKKRDRHIPPALIVVLCMIAWLAGESFARPADLSQPGPAIWHANMEARPGDVESAPRQAAGQEPDTETFHRSPVMFIENMGQWDEGARFQIWGGTAGTIWLTEDAIWITVFEAPEETERTPLDARFDPISDLRPPTSEPRKGAHIKLSFPGANPHPTIETFDRLDTTISYFYGNDPNQWRPDVPVWGGVRYVDLWPGVDLEVGSEDGRLVQRFVAGEGADVSSVRLRVEGAKGAQAAGGALRVEVTDAGQSLPLPVARFSYRLEGIGEAGRAGSWEIRPQEDEAGIVVQAPADNAGDLLYSSFLGGSDDDRAYGIAVDGSGQAYVIGFIDSPDLPATASAYDPTHNGGRDAFVARLATAGSGVDYVTFLGGSAWDYGFAIAVDGSGRAYVIGRTESSDFPTTAEAYDPTQNGGSDVFVARLNGAGSGLEYATFLGGSGDDNGFAISVDGSGRAYVAGGTESSDFPATAGAYDRTLNGSWDAFVACLNGAGSGLEYATFLGGSASDTSGAIAVDNSGRAYVAGATGSFDFPTTAGAYGRTYNGGDWDAFVVRLNGAGSGLEYATFLGGSDGDTGGAIVVDGSERAYVSGTTFSLDFPATAGAYDRTHNGGDSDAFVARLNGAGSILEYATFLGGSEWDSGNAVAVDGSGRAYVAGETRSFDFPATTGAYDRTLNSGNSGVPDAFVARLNGAGSILEYATFLGGSAYDKGNAIAVDGSGRAYLAGETRSFDFPAAAGAYDDTFNGAYDAFVGKLALGIAAMTSTPTATSTYTPSPRVTATATPTLTRTLTPTPTHTHTATPTPTRVATGVVTSTLTPTPTQLPLEVWLPLIRHPGS